MLDVNCYHLAMMHLMAIPVLFKRTKAGKRCGLVGVGSCTSLYPTPGFLCYSASKGFSWYVNHTLQYELKQDTKNRGDLIDVHAMLPFGIATNLVKEPHKVYFSLPPCNRPAWIVAD